MHARDVLALRGRCTNRGHVTNPAGLNDSPKQEVACLRTDLQDPNFQRASTFKLGRDSKQFSTRS